MITQCPQCGGLRAEPGEMYAGTPCECQFSPAPGYVAIRQIIPGDDLWEIHDLAQRVLQSRQNVGTAMKEQARKVVAIVQRLNRGTPHNSVLGCTTPEAKERK